MRRAEGEIQEKCFVGRLLLDECDGFFRKRRKDRLVLETRSYGSGPPQTISTFPSHLARFDGCGRSLHDAVVPEEDIGRHVQRSGYSKKLIEPGVVGTGPQWLVVVGWFRVT